MTLCLIYSFVGEVLTATFIKPRNRPSHSVWCFLVPHSSSLCPDSFQHSKKHCWDHIQFYPYHSQFKKIIILMGHLWSLIQRSQPLWFCLKIGSKGYLLQIPVSLVYEGLWWNLKIRSTACLYRLALWGRPSQRAGVRRTTPAGGVNRQNRCKNRII